MGPVDCFSETSGQEPSVRHMGFCRTSDAECDSEGVGRGGGEDPRALPLLGAETSPVCSGWHCLPNLGRKEE